MKKLLTIALILCLVTSMFGQGQSGVGPMLGQQINWADPITKGLAGYWPFNEGTGDTVFDLSGNGNTGTFQGTAPSWTVDKFGSAVLLPGTDEYIDCGDNPSLDSSHIMTLAIWLKHNGAWPSEAGIIAKRINTVWQYGFGVSSDAIYWLQSDGEGWDTLVSGGSPPSANVWHFLAGTNDGSVARFYIDGKEVGTPDVNPTTSIGTSIEPLKIGSAYVSDVDRYFNGLLDLPMIYNRALIAQEIGRLYPEPFCMFKQDDIAMMAKAAEAPPAEGGQVIIIQMSAISIFAIILIKRRKWQTKFT